MSDLSANLLAGALALAAAVSPLVAAAEPSRPDTTIEPLQVAPDLTLRRLIVRNPQAAGTVLLLHGFPETVHAWEGVASFLGSEFQVHAFDWPGFGGSSRPPVGQFAYTPRDYARVLKAYIEAEKLDRSKLTIYATDIGALPALLLALDEPDIARTLVVGDFAPFDRPAHMYESLQALKGPPTASAVQAHLNRSRDEILANSFTRGLSSESRFEISASFQADLGGAWTPGTFTPADAFAAYYSRFTRDQNELEGRLADLRTPVRVVWGSEDLYIRPAMGAEFAERTGAPFTVLPGIGHYPHLQSPKAVAELIRAAAR
jgi:pimeloyl-ACP methyl ester carboxylesterase